MFSVLLAEAVLPIGELQPLVAIGALTGSVLVIAVAIGLVESLLARFTFRRVPLLLTTAFLLCLFEPEAETPDDAPEAEDAPDAEDEPRQD
jgi:formate hydrogenlyase subunit 4